MRVASYPSIYNLGHKVVAEIFNDSVLVQEKVDGSQISFGEYPVVIDRPAGVVEAELHVRSKGAEIQILAPDKMFATAVKEILARQPLFRLGWTYRGEYLAKPKHNALAYDRVPVGHIILFDIDRGEQDYLRGQAFTDECQRINLEWVPTLDDGMVSDVQTIRALLDRTSILGGQKIEGVVVKSSSQYGPDKKLLMAKFVSEAFKEVHGAEWKLANPSKLDVIDGLVAQYRTPARWAKAVQHLRDAGVLDDSPKDIGELFKEVPRDTEAECSEAIKDALYAYAWPKIRRGLCAGLPEWYKERLLEKQFDVVK